VEDLENNQARGVQAPVPVQLQAPSNTVSRPGSNRRPHSPFRVCPNYAILKSVLAALLFAAPGAARATIINARSPSLADIRDAIARAADGDTVIVPAGTAAWSSTLNITKAITLIGQTTTDSGAGTAVDNTIITDNLTRVPGGTPIIRINSALGKSYRLSGLTFQGQSTAQNNNGAIVLAGDSHALRLDHCHFMSSLQYQSIHVAIFGAIWGVADHNVMEFVKGESFTFYMSNWPNTDGTAGQNGDGSWATPTNLGGPAFFFVEDNYLINRSSFNEFAGNTDDLEGGRWVFRYNHCYDIEIQTHGTEGGRFRGGRAREIYHNDFHNAHAHGTGGIRSGVTITHDNSYHGVQPTHGLVLQAYRAFFKWPACPFLGGTGDNPWDQNDTEGNGTWVEGHTPHLYESGTASGGSPSSVIDNTKNWTPNQWANYTAKRVSDNQVAFIESNTRNALKVSYYTDSGGGAVWKPGDPYQIFRPLVLLDQPGRGKGDLVVGSAPLNSKTATVAWPHQQLEPSYSWNDKHTPTNTSVNFQAGSGNGILQQAGRDYFNNTPIPGYQPYTYPHPLTKGMPPPEQTTRNATGNWQHDPNKKRRPWGGKKPERKQAKKAKESPTNEMPEGQENVGD